MVGRYLVVAVEVIAILIIEREALQALIALVISLLK